MEDQLGALGIVLNCIVLWNTVYIDAALQQLRAQGYLVRDEDVECYSKPHIKSLIALGVSAQKATALTREFESSAQRILAPPENRCAIIVLQA